MTTGEYVRAFNDLIAAVSDSSKDDARHFAGRIVESILRSENLPLFERFVDDLLVAWYDTYKGGGRGPFLPREVAGIPRKPPQ